MIATAKLCEKFIAYFGGELDDVEVFCGPGRVNLIGEHIDYNGGLVMPAALTLGIMAAVRWRDDTKVRMFSENCSARIEFDLQEEIEFDMERYDWGNYPRGVMKYLIREELFVRGCDILYWGDLPDGAGLSSSAAIEVLTAYMILHGDEGKNIDRVWLAQFAQKVENDFIGVNCGIMDQFAVAMGRASHAMMLDCATLNHKYIKSEMTGYTLVIMNTNKRRELAESKYNERRAECEKALAIINAQGSKGGNLCQVSMNDLECLKDEPVLYKRARHVVSEQNRVIVAAQCLAKNDLKEFGNLLNQSHLSLRDDYEVTGLELDSIVAAAWAVPCCIGARMTGAGFGGCAIALVQSDKRESFKEIVAKVYKDKTGLDADFYDSVVGDGVKKLLVNS